MKHLLVLAALVVLSCTASQAFAQSHPFIKDYVERLENSRKYLLKVAEMMPEEKYNYKASPESLSFAENLLHIGFAIDWHSQSLLGGRAAREW